MVLRLAFVTLFKPRELLDDQIIRVSQTQTYKTGRLVFLQSIVRKVVFFPSPSDPQRTFWVLQVPKTI